MNQATLISRGIPAAQALLLLHRSHTILARELKKHQQDPLELPPYFKDRRTVEEYITDIVEWRLVEDALCYIFMHIGLEVTMDGTDQAREILRKWSHIRSDQDMIVNGYKVEIQMARKNLSSYDMKEYKIHNMIRDKSCIFWVLVETWEFFTIREENVTVMDKKVNAKRWGKIVYNISDTRLRESWMIKKIKSLSIWI